MNTLRLLSASTLLVVLVASSLIAQSPAWQRLSGPEGGQVRSLVRTPDGTLVAVLNGEGLFRSNDGGTSWTPLASQSIPAMGMVLHVTHSGTLLLASPDTTLFGSFLYRSTDMGNNWSLVNSDLYWRISLANDSSGGVICAGVHDVYRSTDDGLSWSELTTFEDEVSALAVGADGRLVAAVERSFSPRGVQVSTDLGATWSHAQIGDENTPTILAIGATPDGALFAGTGGGGLFRSNDGGATWVDVSIEQYYYYAAFAVPDDGSLLVATTRGVYRSTNGGAEWQQVGNEDTRMWTPALALAPDGTILAGTQNSGIYAVDGNRWRQSSHGLPPLGAGALAVAPGGTIITIPDNGRFFISDDNGATWTEPDNTRYFGPVLTVDAEGRVYAAASVPFTGYGVAYSPDHGSTWALGDSGMENEWVRALQVGRQGEIYAGVERGNHVFHSSMTDGLFVSSDRGETWTTLGTGLQGTTPVSIVELGDGTLFIGSQYEHPVMRLDPGDTLWQEVSSGLPAPSLQFDIQLYALIADNAGTLYAATQRGLFRSSDRGANWQRTGMEIADTAFTALTLAPTGRIIAATMEYGVYASDDHGATWRSLGGPTKAPGFHMLAVDSTGALLAANSMTGLYRATTTSSVPMPAASINAGLAVHPNPGSTQGAAEFALSTAGYVRLVLYTSAGQRVTVVSEGTMSAGRHRVALDLSDYPSGSYRLRLETERGSEQIGLVVVR